MIENYQKKRNCLNERRHPFEPLEITRHNANHKEANKETNYTQGTVVPIINTKEPAFEAE